MNRYYDPTLKAWVTKILPGELHTCGEDEVVATTLGSCVAACIRDPISGYGGMNHFMLAESKEGDWADVTGSSARYGNFAMEKLINAIIQHGGAKKRLEVKIYGGGRMIQGSTINIGQDNIAFARAYLEKEGLRIIEEDVGESYARKVHFTPATGEVIVKKIQELKNDTIEKREKAYSSTLHAKEPEGDIELF